MRFCLLTIFVLCTVILVGCGDKIAYQKTWDSGYGKYNPSSDRLEFEDQKCSDDCATYCGQANFKYLAHYDTGTIDNYEKKDGEIVYGAVEYGCVCQCKE